MRASGIGNLAHSLLTPTNREYGAEIIVSRADEAMYKAKHQGKNCVAIAPRTR
jgi:GGDEF domain-containing protein